MDPDRLSFALPLALALTAANAVFVAAEFALLTVRRSRIEQVAREAGRGAGGGNGAHRVQEMLLAAQLGSSASTILLGYVTADFGLHVLRTSAAVAGHPAWGGWDVSSLSILALAFAVATVLHVVVGAQVPKLLGVQRAEWIAVRLSEPPFPWLGLLLIPITWPLARLVGAVARLFGLSPAGIHPLVHTPEEIRMLVSHGHEQGVVEEDEREMIHGVFEFSETVAREVMTPRTDMVAVPTTIELDELVRLVVSEGHSRLPVYEGNIDNVVGVLLAKDLLPILWHRREASPAGFQVRTVMREPYFVPDTKPVDDILAEFRQHSVHLAIVLDEFGGTYGLVTMEDLLEEIVGDINDEYDVAEPDFAPTPEGDVLIDGGASISEVNERFGLELPEEDYDTIGGYIFGALGRVPVLGDAVSTAGPEGEILLQVEEIEDRRIIRVRLSRLSSVPDAVA